MAGSPFVPTPQEQALVSAILASADPQKSGVVQGDAAVNILSGANLPPATLGTIWQIADDENNGFLTRKGVGVAVRLIGYAQKGEVVSEELLKKPGPLAAIKGIQAQLPAAPTSPVAKPPAPGPRTLPPLTPEDRTKFLRMFNGFGPVQGVLTGDKAKEVFLRSKLPLEKLGQIWNLVDTQMRGALDSTDFTLGMYFIQSCMSHPAIPLPATLPPGLYEQAAGKGPLDSVRTHVTGGSGRASPGLGGYPTSPLKPQYTGPPVRAQYTGQPLSTHHTGQSLLSNPPASRLSMAPTGNTLPKTPVYATPTTWDVTAQEKANADTFFNDLDSGHKGYIEGDVAVPFMLKSQLPEADLAQIWDLADLNKDGRLTQEGFAVALHLINGKLLGREVPNVLPLSLVPPSHRQGAPAPQPSEPQKDLWLLDDTPPSSATDSHFRSSTASNATFATAQTTATPTPSSRLDLLSDDDSASTARVVPSNSVEIGNMENQLNSTNKSLEAARAEREALEKTVGYSALSLSQLESQLASAKAGYETESRLLADLKERHATQAALISKTREELIHAESDLSAMRLEKSEIERGVLRDKEEVRDLQRNMRQVTEETELLKLDIEKMKKDTRHQKGLLAINKKQLAAAEAERGKAEKELEASKQELAEAEKEVADSEQAIKQHEETRSSFDLAFSEPTQVSRPISPLSTGSKNPFDKYTSAAAVNPTNPMAFSPFGLPPVESHEPSTITSPDPFGLVSSFAAAPAPVASPPIPLEIPSPAAQETAVVSPSSIALPRSPSPVSLASPTLATIQPAQTSLESPPVHTVSPKSGTVPPRQGSTQIDEAASHFPPLEDQDDNLETDLPPLKEIVEEDDSSDDDSDDYEDARAHRAAQTPDRTRITASNEATGDDSEDKKSLSPTPRALSPEATTSSTFDDVFGSATTSSMVEVSPPHSHSAKASENAASVDFQPLDGTGKDDVAPASTQPPSAPSPLFETKPTQEQPPVPLRGSSLDDAFGITSSKPSTVNPDQFNFNANFDDAFDFATFTPAATAPVPQATNQGTVATSGADPFGVPTTTTSPALPAAPGFSFEDAFGSQPAQVPASVPAPGPQKQDSVNFDDVFGITPTNNFDNAFGLPPAAPLSPIQTSAQSNALPPPLPNRVQNEVSLAYSPVTENLAAPVPRGQPAHRTIESPRSRSPSDAAASTTSTSTPPPRARSPKPAAPRLSRYEPPLAPPLMEPPVKTSRFHLPLFGRSKTTKKPSRPKSPAPGRAVSTASSASLNGGQDDVEGVKQIMDMGFTRNQAVAALEKYHYDVNRALNYLAEENAL